MTHNLIELFRERSVKSCFSLSAFVNGWGTWKSEIQNQIGTNLTANKIINLGDSLSTIFTKTGGGNRSQSDVSGGGYGWEGLICWYLNLCLVGSRGVAFRKVSELPLPLRNAISVNYGNFRSNTEADIIVIIFPNIPEFTDDKNNIILRDSSGIIIPNYVRKNYNHKSIADRLTEEHFDRFEMGIIQCKTNWNDNAQIPMLWSMIYEADFSNTAITIGSNNFSIKDLRKFTYSFCTVPSNGIDEYNQNSTAVNRVRNLTGGNYWGYSTINGVASSIKEIFNANFRSAYTNSANHRTTLQAHIQFLSNNLSYFGII